MNSMSYNNLLLKLLNNDKDKHLFNDELLLNIYLTLLSINNHTYHEDIYIKQLDNATCDINQLRVSLHSQLTGTLVPNTDCVMIVCF